MTNSFFEKRSEPRSTSDQYHSVEISIGGFYFVHQFKIWDISLKGMCVLVKEGSVLLEHIKVGDVLRMKYYMNDLALPTEYLETAIRHISKDAEGKFKGHYLVGISILEE